MLYTLKSHSLSVALSWLACRANDPGEEDADAPHWHHALESGKGTADLPRHAWQIIADDLLRESESEVFCDDETQRAKYKRNAANLRREAHALLTRINASS